MALLLCDSFDHYTDPLVKNWVNLNSITIGPTAARNGTNGLYLRYLNSYCQHTLGSTYSEVTVGFAFKCAYSSTAQVTIFSLPSLGDYDSGGSFRMDHMGGTGDIRFYHHVSSGDQYMLQLNGAMPWNVWHYFECSVVLNTSATSGKLVVRVNGVELLRDLDIDTTGYSNYCNAIMFGQGGNGYDGYYRYIDDLYVNSTFDDFYGDVKVECKVPNGAGNYTQWDPSTGNNWECVNEIPPDTGDYVSTSTAGDKDTYTKAALATTSGSVKGVMATMLVQKSSTGTRTIRSMSRLSGSDQPASTVGVGSDWQSFQQELARPGGGSWSIADVNSAEFGVELVS